MSYIDEKVKTLIAKQLELKEERVTETSKIIEDLGVDSLDIIEIVSIMEENFGVNIPDEDEKKIKTVGDLILRIEEKMR